MKKVIITGKAHPILAEKLSAAGYTTDYRPAIAREELIHDLPGTEGIVLTTRLSIDQDIINQAPDLKWIGRLGSGMELIDTEYAATKNILCVSSPEGNRNAVAEHALGLLLNLMNNLTTAQQEVKTGLWKRDENRGTELSGKTVGLIGFGNTGSSFAALLKPFGVTVLAYDKYKFGFGGEYIKEASLEQICRYAQVISFHVPLTDETFHMGDYHFFQLLEQKPWVLNTSRGTVIHQADLLRALDEKLIAGAGLDVLENEDPASITGTEAVIFKGLLAKPNVMITPHIAGYSHEAFYKMAIVLLEKLGLH